MTTLPTVPWTRRADLAGLVAALDPAGESLCRWVGGAVRDTLAGVDVKDIDMATSLLPETVMARLAAGGRMTSAVFFAGTCKGSARGTRRLTFAPAAARTEAERRPVAERGAGPPRAQRRKQSTDSKGRVEGPARPTRIRAGLPVVGVSVTVYAMCIMCDRRCNA